mmetsp:Transcript_33329/g.78154  ORF Transcript_33329/g.78154 Transcript_33329/m.78154 type:complete len:444 (+) Transcript_33329:89-1420(+)
MYRLLSEVSAAPDAPTTGHHILVEKLDHVEWTLDGSTLIKDCMSAQPGEHQKKCYFRLVDKERLYSLRYKLEGSGDPKNGVTLANNADASVDGVTFPMTATGSMLWGWVLSNTDDEMLEVLELTDDPATKEPVEQGGGLFSKKPVISRKLADKVIGRLARNRLIVPVLKEWGQSTVPDDSSLWRITPDFSAAVLTGKADVRDRHPISGKPDWKRRVLVITEGMLGLFNFDKDPFPGMVFCLANCDIRVADEEGVTTKVIELRRPHNDPKIQGKTEPFLRFRLVRQRELAKWTEVIEAAIAGTVAVGDSVRTPPRSKSGSVRGGGASDAGGSVAGEVIEEDLVAAAKTTKTFKKIRSPSQSAAPRKPPRLPKAPGGPASGKATKPLLAEGKPETYDGEEEEEILPMKPYDKPEDRAGCGCCPCVYMWRRKRRKAKWLRDQSHGL